MERVPEPGKCKHESFAVSALVNRLEDIGRFQLDLRVVCEQCSTPFRFIGLPGGVDLNGASCSADGMEGRFAIAPKGEVIPPMSGPVGFSIRKIE